MSNIRDLIREYSRETGLAVRTVQNGAAGVLFRDENEFIPFADLGYNTELGFYRLSAFPEILNEADSSNPWTVHPVTSHDGWQSFALVDPDGFGTMLGEDWELADAAAALAAAVQGHLSEPIPEDAEELGTRWLSIDEACVEANAYDPDRYTLDDRLAYRIRQAARRGTLTGAVQTGTGRWKFQARRFRFWLVSEAAHRPGPAGQEETK